MGVSENRGTPKSSILIGFSIMNHPFWGIPIFGNTHIYIYTVYIYVILGKRHCQQADEVRRHYAGAHQRPGPKGHHSEWDS